MGEVLIADVAKSVDAADFNWSARAETRGVEPLNFGESSGTSCRANPEPSPALPGRCRD